jgi:uncharacterized protein with GYD domain
LLDLLLRLRQQKLPILIYKPIKYKMMIFITLAKFRKKPTKETIAAADKIFKASEKKGVKNLGTYWTLGRYDAVRVVEAPDLKTAMWVAVQLGDVVASETLPAIKREEAIKLLS